MSLHRKLNERERMAYASVARLERERDDLRAQLAKVNALLREKDDVLMAVKEQFDRHGNSFPDRFDSRVFRWVADALSASAEPSAPVERDELTRMVDAAMVEMSNIHPPLGRGECARLIRAALERKP